MHEWKPTKVKNKQNTQPASIRCQNKALRISAISGVVLVVVVVVPVVVGGTVVVANSPASAAPQYVWKIINRRHDLGRFFDNGSLGFNYHSQSESSVTVN